LRTIVGNISSNQNVAASFQETLKAKTYEKELYQDRLNRSGYSANTLQTPNQKLGNF